MYVGSADDAALNASVERLTASTPASAFLDAHSSPTGPFKTKTPTLHNLSDPLVPFSQERIFGQRVKQTGNTAQLVQQIVDARAVDGTVSSGPQHCFFTPGQLTYAWYELRVWVKNGTAPMDGLNIIGR